MKIDNTVSRIEVIKSREASHLCCLTRVNSLLKALRTKQDRSINARRAAEFPHGEAADQQFQVPSLHDVYAIEIEASLSARATQAGRAAETAIAYDSPAEIARARLVFAISLSVPLILIAAGLVLFDGQMGRASTTLLKFSAFALATPLVMALAGTALLNGWRGLRAHPVLAMVGVAATTDYAAGAIALSMPVAGISPALTLALAGLLATGVRIGYWARLHQTSVQK